MCGTKENEAELQYQWLPMEKSVAKCVSQLSLPFSVILESHMKSRGQNLASSSQDVDNKKDLCSTLIHDRREMCKENIQQNLLLNMSLPWNLVQGVTGSH